MSDHTFPDDYYFVLDGHEARPATSYEDIVSWMESEKRIVAKTKIGDVEVSTVFLCINHAFADGPPVVFETMVFGGRFDQECERYHTWDEAAAGHETWVTAVRALADIDARADEPEGSAA